MHASIAEAILVRMFADHLPGSVVVSLTAESHEFIATVLHNSKEFEVRFDFAQVVDGDKSLLIERIKSLTESSTS